MATNEKLIVTRTGVQRKGNAGTDGYAFAYCESMDRDVSIPPPVAKLHGLGEPDSPLIGSAFWGSVSPVDSDKGPRVLAVTMTIEDTATTDAVSGATPNPDVPVLSLSAVDKHIEAAFDALEKASAALTEIMNRKASPLDGQTPEA